MTRFLEKDKKTQVNSNLIGVQVRPGVARVDDIVVDFTYDTVEVSPVAYIDEHTYQLITDSNNNVYRESDDTVEYNNVIYYGFYLYDGAENAESVLWTEEEVRISAKLYKLTIVDGEVVDLEQASLVKTLFDYEGTAIITSSDGLVEGGFGAELYVSGDYLVDENGDKWALIVDRKHHIDNDVEFYDGGSDETGGLWANDDYAEDYGGIPIELNTATSKPVAGDKAYYFGDPDYNVQTIKSVVAEEEELDCVISYSVDGEIWSDWSETLDADNNVIANIPRYMYLKFSKDVVITEE